MTVMHNPLRTRRDLQQAATEILRPLIPSSISFFDSSVCVHSTVKALMTPL